MIYLVLKIFGYLLVALLAGFASGWLFRNLTAIKKDETLQGSLNDVRAKLPQFESLLRGRDQQVSKLKEDLKNKEQNMTELKDEFREKEKALLKKTQELKRLKKGAVDDNLLDADIGSTQIDASASDEDAPSSEEGGSDAKAASTEQTQRIEALEGQIVELKKELEESAQAEADFADDTSDTQRDAHRLQELEARIRQQAHDYNRLNKTLEQERRKVVELERERELQHRSLQVLHQQLEIERGQNERHANG